MCLPDMAAAPVAFLFLTHHGFTPPPPARSIFTQTAYCVDATTAILDATTAIQECAITAHHNGGTLLPVFSCTITTR